MSADRLTEAQRRALEAAARGPLFKTSGGRWRRPGVAPIADRPVQGCIDKRLFERGVARNGSPMVLLTDAGRDIVVGRLSSANRDRDVPASLSDRIAP